MTAPLPDPPAHRLAVVLSHPTQYYSPWFRWLRAHTALPFRVFYLWDFGVVDLRDRQFGTNVKWDVDLLSGYDATFVPNKARDPGTHHFGGLENPDLPAELSAWRPTAVLFFGYNWSAHLRAIFWAWRHRVPMLFRGDSHFLGRGAPPWRTRLLLGTLYARFAAFLAVGVANRDYFTALGVPEQKIFFAPHAVDATHFDPTRADYREAAAKLRAQLGIALETRVVLFAGKFLPAKQPRELLQAFVALDRPGTALVLVGDGEEKTALQDLARTARPDTVHFLPFANQSEMPARLLLADVFALPSKGLYETWGLAVNEAMHLGVPALVSDRVGCQRDLVTPGQTGWVFPAEEPGALQRELGRALDTVASPGARERLRTAVLARIAGYTYAQTTAGLLQALAALPARRR